MEPAADPASGPPRVRMWLSVDSRKMRKSRSAIDARRKSILRKFSPNRAGVMKPRTKPITARKKAVMVPRWVKASWR